MNNWLNELDLSFNGPSVKMGLRKLDDRPWLLADKELNTDLALKRKLTRSKSKIVFLSRAGSEEAGNLVVSMLESHGVEINSEATHPLERAGLSVQEDLCLLHRSNGFWQLEAASLCFPSRWKLGEKIGTNMSDVHGPVEGYEKHLSKKVDNFFDRLGDGPVWRRNWFIHPDNSLHQPQRPLNGDPIVEFGEIGEKLFIRSERQTLQRLDIPGWILFTIRIQRTPLMNLLLKRKEEFQKWIFEAPESHHDHKGLVVEQVAEIRKALVN